MLSAVVELKGINADTLEEEKAQAKIFIDEELGKKRWTIEEFLNARVEIWPDHSMLFVIIDIEEVKS